MNVIKKSLYAIALLFGFHFAASDLELGSRICAQDDVVVDIEMGVNPHTNIGSSAEYNSVAAVEDGQGNGSQGNWLFNCFSSFFSRNVSCSEVDTSGCSSSLNSCGQSAMECGNSTSSTIENCTSACAPVSCSTSLDAIAECGSRGSSIVENCVASGRNQYNRMSKVGKICCAIGTCFIVATGTISGVLVGTHDMTDNYYHADNQSGKVLKLHYRGNGPNRCTKPVCTYKESCTTDSSGNKTCSTKKTCVQEVVDCIKILYQDDRATVVNYGHLTKLCGRYYDPYFGRETGSTECVTEEGLKYFNWVLHDVNHRIVFTRNDDYYSNDAVNQISINATESNRMNAEQACTEEYVYEELDDQNQPLLTRRNCYASLIEAEKDRAAREREFTGMGS